MTKINTGSKKQGDKFENRHFLPLFQILNKTEMDSIKWSPPLKLILKLMASQQDAIKKEMNSSHDRNERIQDTGYRHRDNIEKTLKMKENMERLNRVLKIMILTFKTGENVPTKQPVKRHELAIKPTFLKRLFTVISAVLTPFLR